jgi:hypothetical protein
VLHCEKKYIPLPDFLSIKFLDMETALQITDKEFVAKHDSFFGLANSGKQVLIRWGDNRFFYLMPTASPVGAAELNETADVYEPEDDGFRYAPGLFERIEAARQEAREGKGTVCHTREELIAHLKSL